MYKRQLFDLSELATTISIDLLKQYAVFNSIFWPLSFPFANALRAAGRPRLCEPSLEALERSGILG